MIKYQFDSLPQDWKVKKLVEVATFLDGKRVPVKESDRVSLQGHYPYYGASGIIDYVNDFIFDGDYILVGEDGANILSRSTPLAFRVTGKVWINNHAHVLEPKKMMDIGFLTEYLESISYIKYNTGTAQPKLPQSTLSKVDVIIPPLPEQHRIAEILSTWDEAIAKTEQLIAALRERKKGLMQRLLSGQVRFAGFEGEWKEKRLGEVVEIIYGKSPKDIPVENGLYPIYGTGGIVGYTNTPMYLKEALIIGRKGSIDQPQLSLTPFWAIDTTFYCVAKIDLDLTWLYYLLAHKGLSQYNEGSTIPSLSRATLSGLKIHLPVFDEQRKIASVLSESDREIAIQIKIADKLQRQKKGLMQRLLTGEIRVKI